MVRASFPSRFLSEGNQYNIYASISPGNITRVPHRQHAVSFCLGTTSNNISIQQGRASVPAKEKINVPADTAGNVLSPNRAWNLSAASGGVHPPFCIDMTIYFEFHEYVIIL